MVTTTTRTATLCLVAALVVPVEGQGKRRFTEYRDVYFMASHSGYRDDEVENKLGLAKFQYSSQLNLVDGTFALIPWKRRVHVNAFMGYTQESFWRLYDDSAPFLEHNFNPELFLAYDHVGRFDKLQLGLIEHESTGVDSKESRGWNRFCVLVADTMRASGIHCIVEEKLWGIYDTSSENGDIEDYQRGRLAARIEKPQVFRLAAAWRPGQKELLNFEAEAGYSGVLPLTVLRLALKKWWDLRYEWEGIYTSVHYWDGYGEGLVEYKARNRSFAVGLSMVRQF